MSRAMRRQSLVQKPPAKTPSFRPSGARPAPKQQSAAAVETTRSKHFYDPIVRYFRDIVSELKKVTWPTREETLRLTIAGRHVRHQSWSSSRHPACCNIGCRDDGQSAALIPTRRPSD